MSSTIKQAIQALKSRVADAFAAVEAKGGTLPATQDTANLPAAIASIPSGGGVVEKEEKDVLFIDYDGTIIASYTYEEFESVTDYPTPPVHEGLTFVGWTNTLEELKTYKRKITLSGALYKSTDDNYHIIIKTFAPNQTFSFQTDTSIEVNDWGDGTGGETSASGLHSHTYASEGRYDIALKGINSIGALTALRLYVPDLNSKQMVIGVIANSYSNEYYELIRQAGLNNAPNLEFIVAPTYALLLGGNDCVANCPNLKAIVSTYIGGAHRAMQNTGIKYLTGWCDGFYKSWATDNRRLRRVNFPTNPTVTYDGTNAFQNCANLQYIWLNPNAGLGTMSGCYAAREIHIPHTSVPSLPNTNYFTGIPTTCKIYVKTGLLSQYETATNWSTIYSQYEFIEED